MPVIPRFKRLVSLQLGAIIRYRLKEKGIKHNFVAQKIGISPAYFKRLLDGDEFPSDTAIETVAEILGLTPHELCLGVVYPNNLAEFIESEEN